jgi:REP element-mobilizing transposase RayT
MARPYRLQAEGCFYHITSRGDDRKRIYVSEADFDKFLEYLLEAKKKYGFYLYAYCLMSNHYHLLIETSRPNLSQIMHYVNGSYTNYYNIKRKRCGHVFQGRYKSIVVDKDSYFQELSRYIHRNPVKAKIVERPEEYRWSSYAGYIGKKDKVIDHEQVKLYLGMSAGEYREFVEGGPGNGDNIFGSVYAGFLLGSEGFIKDKLKTLGEKVESREYSFRGLLNSTEEADGIIGKVAGKYGISEETLLASKNKSFPAKKVAIYLLKRHTGLTNAEIGEKFGITFSAVSKVAKEAVEFMRKDRCARKAASEILSRFKG